MTKTAPYSCTSCSQTARKWSGQCPHCGSWNTLIESVHGQPATDVQSLANVSMLNGSPRPTGVEEFDRLFGGGLLPGSVTLLYGEPGAGKSTLLSQVAIAAAARATTVLLVCAEESVAQVRLRTERLGELPAELLVIATTSLDEALTAAEQCNADLVIVDSIQALRASDVAGPSGAINQLRTCAERLVALAKHRGPAVIIVGHVTKDGEVAGPRSLEHMVDTVVAFEGDRHQTLRIARSVKHRFGTTGEVGLFEMGSSGLAAVQDPGRLLLDEHVHDVAGSALAIVLEGHRPLITELQTLVVDSHGGMARRTASGIDHSRLSLLLAVLEARCGLSLAGLDVFASVTGGLRATEPAVDLPLALAITAAVSERSLPRGLASFGEVGLAGELRRVRGAERRILEASRLGLAHVIVPASTPDVEATVNLHRAATLDEAIELARELG
ncbi:MAG: DNA repair protein RadA [Actinomycetota bacterium]